MRYKKNSFSDCLSLFLYRLCALKFMYQAWWPRVAARTGCGADHSAYPLSLYLSIYIFLHPYLRIYIFLFISIYVSIDVQRGGGSTVIHSPFQHILLRISQKEYIFLIIRPSPLVSPPSLLGFSVRPCMYLSIYISLTPSLKLIIYCKAGISILSWCLSMRLANSSSRPSPPSGPSTMAKVKPSSV